MNKTKTSLNLILFVSLLLTACNSDDLPSPNSITPSGSDSQNTSTGTEVPAKWPSSSFPLVIGISEDFTDGERSDFEAMGDKWEAAGNFEADFFEYKAASVSNRDLQSIEDYYDDEMGIYKNSKWYANGGERALAITQFFFLFVDRGGPNEHFELTHSDIILNVHHYSFSSDGTGGTYDLPSIILHEMGHFLGLYHVENYSVSSVMHPYISQGNQKREPYDHDEEIISRKYNINQGIYSLLGQSELKPEEAPQSPSEMVRGVLELLPEGKCNHYINGVKVFSHDHDLASN